MTSIGEPKVNLEVDTVSATLREISWPDLFPWQIMFRTLRTALGVQLLLVATVGAIAGSIVWRLSERLFVRADVANQPTVVAYDIQLLRSWPGASGGAVLPDVIRHFELPLPESQYAPVDPHVSVPYRFVVPLRRLLDRNVSWGHWGYYACGWLGQLAVWGLFGGTIARLATLELGREERGSLAAAFSHGRRHWWYHIGTPLSCLLPVVILGGMLAMLGIIMNAGAGMFLAGVVWPVVLLVSAFVAVFLIGLLFGFPLMIPSVAAESSDSYEALSRSFSYVYQRPLHYLFYATVASVIGLVGWCMVWFAAEMVIATALGATLWATGENQSATLLSLVGESSGVITSPPLLFRGGAALIRAFDGLVRAIASGFAYSFFFTASSAIYLLLRYHVDAVELDEVSDPDQPSTFGLSSLALKSEQE
ncbi:MAG: hypothetical protein R3E01_17795 [Pirellulaceae bacterium]|nr:hypothetical protein [Planctomycetales bacterium]